MVFAVYMWEVLPENEYSFVYNFIYCFLESVEGPMVETIFVLFTPSNSSQTGKTGLSQPNEFDL